jgi:hypothetical protein
MIQTAFSTAYSEAAENGDLSDVDLRAALRAADPTDGVLSGILNQSDINIMGKAQELIDQGSTPQDVRDFFFQEIADLNGKLPDINMNTGVALGEYAAALKDFGDKSVLAQQDFQTILGTSDAEREQRIRDLQADMDEAGTATEAINSLTVTFLEAQNALTPPLDGAARVAGVLTGAMESLASMFNQQVEQEDDEQEAPPNINSLLEGQSSPESRLDTNTIESMLRTLRLGGADMLQVPSANGRATAEILDFDQRTLDLYASRDMVTEQFDPIFNTNVYVIQRGPRKMVMLPENYQSTEITPRELGGPIVQGDTYLVGENGPELFVAGDSGFMYNNQDSASVLQSMMGAAPDITQSLFDNLSVNVNRNSARVVNQSVDNIVNRELPSANANGGAMTDLRSQIQEGIASIAESKKLYASTIQRLTQEIKRYNRLNEEGRTIR